MDSTNNYSTEKHEILTQLKYLLKCFMKFIIHKFLTF